MYRDRSGASICSLVANECFFFRTSRRRVEKPHPTQPRCFDGDQSNELGRISAALIDEQFNHINQLSNAARAKSLQCEIQRTARSIQVGISDLSIFFSKDRKIHGSVVVIDWDKMEEEEEKKGILI